MSTLPGYLFIKFSHASFTPYKQDMLGSSRSPGKFILGLFFAGSGHDHAQKIFGPVRINAFFFSFLFEVLGFFHFSFRHKNRELFFYFGPDNILNNSSPL